MGLVTTPSIALGGNIWKTEELKHNLDQTHFFSKIKMNFLNKENVCIEHEKTRGRVVVTSD